MKSFCSLLAVVAVVSGRMERKSDGSEAFDAFEMGKDMRNIRNQALLSAAHESQASFAAFYRTETEATMKVSDALVGLEYQTGSAIDASTEFLTKTQYKILVESAKKRHDDTVKELRALIADLKLSTTSLPAKITAEKQKVSSQIVDSIFKPEVEFTAEVMQDSVDTVEEANEEANNIKKLHIWRGYCSKPAGDNWNEYCLDTVEEDTGKPYFEVDTDTNTRFKALKSGYFRINLRYISNSCNWGHVIVYFGNTYRYHGHNNDRGNWQDKSADLTYWANAGEVFYVRTYAACGDRNSYFSGGEDGKHSRMEVMYMGAKP
eukprot:m.57156 g.57156  ORF g.57156 m.57156 type:complete len:319 (+) comp11084_c0_seq2:104-1060(+)